MPQLDVALYPPQLIWLVISFTLLYLAMAKVALPRISEVLEKRRDRIDGDLDKAAVLKKEADEALAAYEESMAEAKTQALAVIKEASDKLTEDSAARHAELSATIADQAEAAEATIARAKESALADIGGIAEDITSQAAAKLIGAKKVDKKQLQDAVTAAMKEHE
ncbi:MAG: F0F1 ATP synthase subunit B' [Alphaproteobacteria bacterium]|nr:F0F1 ATP synthase subunit B' [Alphaproteobacteria bacterium]